jgi:hypothetical protein
LTVHNGQDRGFVVCMEVVNSPGQTMKGMTFEMSRLVWGDFELFMCLSLLRTFSMITDWDWDTICLMDWDFLGCCVPPLFYSFFHSAFELTFVLHRFNTQLVTPMLLLLLGFSVHDVYWRL